MVLKLYFDFLSQPSRAIYIILKGNNIPFEPVEVLIGQGQHLTEKFAKLNKSKKVPAISDDDFNLSESIAILRYLSRTRQLPTNWYSDDPQAQARIDEYLEWQHLNTRLFCATYFQKAFLFPKLFGKEVPRNRLEALEGNVEKCLGEIERLWLTPGPFINGDHLTAADIWAACEIEQLRMAGFDPTMNHQKLKDWMQRVQKEAAPYYQEAHSKLNQFIKKEIDIFGAKL
ncbi:glutathione S-transferase theta-3-like [Onthophagus taurus]|uniref:glutathione S-transferase theta-3-like n=1 Tax=Onthophagus taurus TaxID=166361 RepID=UPI0039BDFB4A